MNNKKLYKYLLLTIALVFITKIKSGKKMELLKFKEPVRAKLFVIIDALKKEGLSDIQIKLALAQILHETGQFSSKSNVFKLNNNLTGIKFLNKSYQDATKGSPVPPGEQEKPETKSTNFYAKFKDIGAWAKDYIRILNIKNKPINSNSIDEFHAKLTDNKYYDTRKQKNIDNYLKSLRYFYNLIIF